MNPCDIVDSSKLPINFILYRFLKTLALWLCCLTMRKHEGYGRTACRVLYTVHRYFLVLFHMFNFVISYCYPGNLVCLQGSAALSSFPEVAFPSETHSFKGSFQDVSIEKLFVAGILDELKICFSCGYEVCLLPNFPCKLASESMVWLIFSVEQPQTQKSSAS